MSPRRIVHSVGHSTRPIEELVQILRENAIALLVDVRRYPASRRHPQFGQASLERSLAEAGIRYRHEPDLGGRRVPRADSPNVFWREEGFRGYADHMDSAEFHRALDRLVADADTEALAILCAEAVPWRCHRQLVADALFTRGVEVQHILGAGRVEGHAFNPAARVLPDGRLVYDGGQAPLAWPEQGQG
jgi:uncharacterized protein (DUF488 family)